MMLHPCSRILAKPAADVGEPFRGTKSASERGVRIGSHSRSHPDLTKLPAAALTLELLGSKRDIEANVRAPCDVFAYPYGAENALVRTATKDAGYRAAFGAPGDEGCRNPYSVPRVMIVRKDGLGIRFQMKRSVLGRAVIRRSWTLRGRRRHQ